MPATAGASRMLVPPAGTAGLALRNIGMENVLWLHTTMYQPLLYVHAVTQSKNVAMIHEWINQS